MSQKLESIGKVRTERWLSVCHEGTRRNGLKNVTPRFHSRRYEMENVLMFDLILEERGGRGEGGRGGKWDEGSEVL